MSVENQNHPEENLPNNTTEKKAETNSDNSEASIEKAMKQEAKSVSKKGTANDADDELDDIGKAVLEESEKNTVGKKKKTQTSVSTEFDSSDGDNVEADKVVSEAQKSSEENKTKDLSKEKSGSEIPTSSEDNKTEETSSAEQVSLDDKKTEELSTEQIVSEKKTSSKDNKTEELSTEKKVSEESKKIEVSDAKVSNENETNISKSSIDKIVSSKTDEDNEGDDEEEINSSDEDDDTEDETTEDGIDYSSMNEKQLVAEFKKLLESNQIQKIKVAAEEIKNEFNSKFNEELEAKKEEFLAEGGNIIDFHYSTPIKKEFSSLYFDYKEKRNNHYKSLKKDLQANLHKREELVEELKGLLNAEENINTTYKHFKDIQERWRTAGPIPRDKYDLVWKNYHHHVENFYDFLHLNREFRDMDFKHNLDAKLKLIVRAEELAQEKNTNKAFRELQMLHKMWKEEIGPVAKEYRDKVWDQFSDATKVIHDKRQDELNKLEEKYVDNYQKKKDLVAQILEIAGNANNSHQSWQQAMKNVQALRDSYFATGNVPRSNNKEIWNAFKDATREFNRAKNNFYKEQKKDQYTNLEKKKELIKIAEDNKENEDFDTATSLFKKIQSDWKKIGHVPRKDSDKVWKQFKAACNYYFDRVHAKKNVDSKEELEHYDAKVEMLDELEKFEPTGDNKTDIKTIKSKIKDWKDGGKVPYSKRNINQKFNKKLDTIFDQLDMGKKESELIKFDNKLNALTNQDDDRKLRNEHFFISKKIDETRADINQLENNLGFFKHTDEKNPLLMEVRKNIERHKEQLEVWKAKLEKIKEVRE